LLLFTSASAVWYQGGDMSYLPTYDCNGKCSPYKNSSSSATDDSLHILASNRVNTVRLRLWVNPAAADTYCDLQNVTLVAQRIISNKMKFYLDFHYSDTWADPSHQIKPAAWASLSFTDLSTRVYNYSKQTVQSLINAGVAPSMIQVGNEIDCGMLWESNGAACSTGGHVCGSCGSNWPNLRQLVMEGINGVRDGYTELNHAQQLIMIHIARMNGGNAQSVISWMKNLTGGTQVIKYDVIGLSYYEQYNSGPLTNLYSLSSVASAFPDKLIMIAETDYYYTQQGKGTDFPETPQGQSDYLRTMIQIMSNGSVPQGSGVFWWGTEMYNTQWPALFDTKAVALPAMINAWL